MSASLLVRGVVVGSVLGAAFLIACGGSSSGNDDGSSGTAASGDAAADRRFIGQQHPAASCPVTLESFDASGSRNHVPEGTMVTYSSNPPCCGDHYPVWANFQEFTVPLDDGYLVHSLEHGAVALLYKCDGAACAPIQAALRKIRDAVPTDSLCDSSVRVRIIIAPDPKLDVPVAATAWGFTYKAQCVDTPTLAQFIKDNYGQGPEQLCAIGQTFGTVGP